MLGAACRRFLPRDLIRSSVRSSPPSEHGCGSAACLAERLCLSGSSANVFNKGKALPSPIARLDLTPGQQAGLGKAASSRRTLKRLRRKVVPISARFRPRPSFPQDNPLITLGQLFRPSFLTFLHRPIPKTDHRLGRQAGGSRQSRVESRESRVESRESRVES